MGRREPSVLLLILKHPWEELLSVMKQVSREVWCFAFPGIYDKFRQEEQIVVLLKTQRVHEEQSPKGRKIESLLLREETKCAKQARIIDV